MARRRKPRNFGLIAQGAEGAEDREAESVKGNGKWGRDTLSSRLENLGKWGAS